MAKRIQTNQTPPSSNPSLGEEDNKKALHEPKVIWKRWEVVAPIIVALLLGIPTLINEVNTMRASGDAVATSTAKVRPQTATPRPAPKANGNGAFDFTLYFGGADSFTIFANKQSDFHNLLLTTAKLPAGEHIERRFDIFTLMGTSIASGTCLRYERENTHSALPLSCSNPQVITLTSGDIFWYDDAANRPLDVVVKLNNDSLDVCSSASGSCVLHHDAATPTPTL